MGTYGAQVALVIVLVLVNAALSGSEMAFVSLRQSQVRRLADTSRGGRVLARLVNDPNRFLATVQIGITLAGFLASAAAAVSLAEPLVEPLGFLGAAAGPASIVVVTVLLTFVTLVVGELAPKRIAMQRAEGWALLAARPLDLLATVTRPLVWLLGKATDLVVRLTGADPHAARDEVTTEEIRDMITSQRGFSTQQRTIISGAFEIADRVLREVLVPRRDVVSLPGALPAAEGLRRLMASGHSRAPVTGPDGPAGLDDVIGVVHLRDLYDLGGKVGDHVHPAMFLPEALKVSEAMRQMRQQRERMALVVDERGTIDGIVTIEDLVEEVVGEIYDEMDRDVLDVAREPDGALSLVGGFPLHDLADIGVHVEVEGNDYTTVAGLLLARLGHIPERPGETVDLGGYTAEVMEVRRHAITRIRLRPKPPRPDQYE